MQRSSEEQDIAAEIVRLTHRWMEAARAHDAETLEQLMAAEYRLVIMTLAGRFHAVVNRGNWMTKTMQPPTHDFAYTNTHVRVGGEVAVMTAPSTSTATIAREDGTGAAGT